MTSPDDSDDDAWPIWMTHPVGRACCDNDFEELYRLGRAGVTIDDFTESDDPHDFDSHLHRACDNANETLVATLLEIGCPRTLNRFNYIAQTPLMMAAKAGHTGIVKRLIAAGADVNANDEPRIGDTALALACEHGRLEIAHLLLDAGADPTIRGWCQLTAIDRLREFIAQHEQATQGIPIAEQQRETLRRSTEMLSRLPHPAAPKIARLLDDPEILAVMTRKFRDTETTTDLDNARFVLHRMTSPSKGCP